MQELLAQAEQTKASENLPAEPENTDDTTDSPKPKKRKKKDKCEKQTTSEDSVDDGSLSQTCEPDVDGAAVDSNSNRVHKKKKNKRKDSHEVPGSDSSGYLSDKTSRKRPADEVENGSETPVSKKKKKSL